MDDSSRSFLMAASKLLKQADIPLTVLPSEKNDQTSDHDVQFDWKWNQQRNDLINQIDHYLSLGFQSDMESATMEMELFNAQAELKRLRENKSTKERYQTFLNCTLFVLFTVVASWIFYRVILGYLTTSY